MIAEYKIEPKSWQEKFMDMFPRIERQARIAFSNLDTEAREEAISEVVANAMCAYHRLHVRGELERAFATALARFAIMQYQAGRRVGSPRRSGDVYSPQAKQKAAYQMLPLGAPGEQSGSWREYLVDNRRTPIPDQVAFRIDFPLWLESQSPRSQQIAERLSRGHSNKEVAREFRISRGRVSQLRRELAESWGEFVGERRSEGGTGFEEVTSPSPAVSCSLVPQFAC